MHRAPVWYFQEVFTAATALFSPEPTTCFVTTPRIDISGIEKVIVATRKVRVVQENPESVEALLGDKGKHVLVEVIDLIVGASLRRRWPLTHVEIARVVLALRLFGRVQPTLAVRLGSWT